MKRNDNALQLPFAMPGLEVSKSQVQQKLLEQQAKESRIEEDCKRLHPQHTKLFIHFEQECLQKQIELLNWILSGSD